MLEQQNNTATPRVSFVVPCYKFAHLLPECVNSILEQTYGSFEILVMDDCSPDNTPEVARSFDDPRVIHVRNEPNLGHLRNYNKGIGLARGDYIWLISADDRLRQPYALERYVAVMEANPRVGFAFCPGVGLQHGTETRLLAYSVHAKQDCIFQGRDLFLKLLEGNSILAASGMVRRACYEKVGAFPLDLPFSGDWYLWLMFSLHFDAAYFAEPLVNYRYHELAMSNAIVREDVRTCSRNDLLLLLRINDEAEKLGDKELHRKAVDALAALYGDHLASKEYRAGSRAQMSLSEFETSLSEHSNSAHKTRIRSRAFSVAADRFYWRGQFPSALEFYRLALDQNPRMAAVWVKYLLLRTGNFGNYLRQINIRLKESFSASPR